LITAQLYITELSQADQAWREQISQSPAVERKAIAKKRECKGQELVGFYGRENHVTLPLIESQASTLPLWAPVGTPRIANRFERKYIEVI
jgi:hypothetical protein